MKIDKNVPMPKGSKELHPISAALRSMEVGDSVLIADKTRTQVQDYVRKARWTTGHRFAIRQAENGIRVWRIE